MHPYLKDFKSVYCLSFYNPTILIKFSISSLFIIYFMLASLTFNSLPLSGNTPYRSLPTTSIPDIANALAESPSVRIRVHYSEFRFPASLASSNFSIPCNLEFFDPFICLFSLASYLALAYDTIASIMSVFIRALENFSVTLNFSYGDPPKSDTLVVIFSLV